MSALATAKNIDQLGATGRIHGLKVKASTKIFAGAMVAVDATGYAVNAATATALIAVGVALKTVDNSAGASGDLTVDVAEGVFKFANSASTDLIAQAWIFQTCYIVDNQTVAKTDNSAARSAAGKVIQVDSDGVFVLVKPV